ncbi:hypothetical protein CHCC20488_2500 [Bacillus paralicheniformis]|uniref:DUF4238 domain-containing protein n=1 Tax=Bacillus subtilis group TaxID=653685 RepID=UPI0005DAC0E1|nr:MULTISPECIES: DUF4238 domain-containing protein [Bacillus subtilis group]KJH56490.1 hypothetical protein UF14_14630 [Bacillus licheniformis]MEC2098596.1 DUF4238 domain-containing protein [Bacillus paralicheniformis]MEC2114647.1 DUF4238 domain-containing protein [Bacillus paralicheniformis]MEC2318468.1 DUF4238 domain-containing protein [Bacillus paralicheniformis]TWN44945.1 hypothetical protein CHCC14523_2604 [Bacillus paralicheniformis]
MGEKSRQHYVPKFYLRNFSDNDSSIGTFIIAQTGYRQHASIKDMCQKNNFYGDDKVVENNLHKHIESPVGRIIKRIIETDTIPDFEEEFDDYYKLLEFLLVSEARNLKSADSANHSVDVVAKMLLKDDSRFKDVDLDRYEIGLTTPANLIIQNAIKYTPLILDLEPILIVQKTPRKFITSDNPLVRYNSLYVNRNYHGKGSGLVTRGLQIFLPISSQKCLLFYDSTTYDIPKAKNRIITLTKAREVDWLNELFYLNSYDNVYFNQRIKEDYLKKLYYKNRKFPRTKELDREITFFESTGDNSLLMNMVNNRVEKKIALPWINESKFAKDLILPEHMGGLMRMESTIIREYIKMSKKKHQTYTFRLE